ncbi:MAG: hypothetical protein AABW63_03155 [Nanoarchaeota archaeon]
MVQKKYKRVSVNGALEIAGNSPVITSRLLELVNGEYIPQDALSRSVRRDNAYSSRQGYTIPPKETVQKVYDLVNQDRKDAAKVLGFSLERLDEVLVDYGLVQRVEAAQRIKTVVNSIRRYRPSLRGKGSRKSVKKY